MREAGFDNRVIRLAGSVGTNSLKETEEILKKEFLSQDDIAFLILHYVDDYTINSDWVKQSELSSDNTLINDLDRRMYKNEVNQRYIKLNEEGREHFNGETSFEAQRRIGHLVEERLASLINKNSNQSINSKDLPQFIDTEIKNKIEALT